MRKLSIEYIVRVLADAEYWDMGYRELFSYNGELLSLGKESGGFPYVVEGYGKKSFRASFATVESALLCACNGLEMSGRYKSILDVLSDCRSFMAA